MKKRNLYDKQGNCINCDKKHESVNKKFREYKQPINYNLLFWLLLIAMLLVIIVCLQGAYYEGFDVACCETCIEGAVSQLECVFAPSLFFTFKNYTMKENLILTALCVFIGYITIVIFKVNNKGFKFRNKPDFKKKKQSKQT